MIRPLKCRAMLRERVQTCVSGPQMRRLLPHWDAFVLMWLHYSCILLYIIRSRTESIKRSDRQRGKRLEQTLPICVGETPGADKTLRHKQAHKHQVWEKTYTFYTRLACENTVNRFSSPVISWKTGCFFLLLIRFFSRDALNSSKVTYYKIFHSSNNPEIKCVIFHWNI